MTKHKLPQRSGSTPNPRKLFHVSFKDFFNACQAIKAEHPELIEEPKDLNLDQEAEAK